MADEEGVLGNLPRSRPGQRSSKRAASTSETAARRAERAERAGAPAAKPTGASTQPPETEPPPPADGPGRNDPIGGLLRTGAKVAGTGVRVAADVAGHVLRRIPRP